MSSAYNHLQIKRAARQLSRPNAEWNPFRRASQLKLLKEDRENYESFNGREVEEQQDHESRETRDSPRRVKLIPRHLFLRFPHNEYLIDRPALFAALDQILQPTTYHQSAALWGKGGCGKTNIALEYIYRQYHTFALVIWVDAFDETTFVKCYQEAARDLGVPNNLEGDELLAAVRRAIEDYGRYLLVIDNATDLGLFGVSTGQEGQSNGNGSEAPARNLARFIPRGTGTVLWTSRDAHIVGLVGAQRALQVGCMSAEEARSLFEAVRGGKVEDDEADEVERLLRAFHWQPWAVTKLATLLREKSITIGDMLNQVLEGRKDMDFIVDPFMDQSELRGHFQERSSGSRDIPSAYHTSLLPRTATEGQPFDQDTIDTRSTIQRSLFDHPTTLTSTHITGASSAPPSAISHSLLAKVSSPSSSGQILAGSENDQDDIAYSEAGSVADHEEIYVNGFCNELLQDVQSLDLTDIELLLPELLKEFAVRIGYQGDIQDYRDIMYIAHKHHRTITRDICRAQRGPNEDHASIHTRESVETVSSDAYYNSFQNIDRWRTEDEFGKPETSTVESDTVETKLGSRREKLRSSEAYRWLISALNRNVTWKGVEVETMNDHRKWLMALLDSGDSQSRKISRRRAPDVYVAEIDLSWDPLAFFKQQDYDAEDIHLILGKVITLSGDGQMAQALPCSEYLQQVWPSTGLELLRFLQELIQTPRKSHSCILPDKTEVSGEMWPGSTYLQITGTRYNLAETVQQLFWISAALQVPEEESGAFLYFAKPTGSFYPRLNNSGRSDHAQIAGTAFCKVRFERKRLDQKEQLVPGNCWHNLFRHCVIAAGYPVRSRSGPGPGLEIPLEMMAALACAEHIIPFCGNLLLKGFSTLLFPTHADGEYVYWHAICNQDGSRISFADERALLSPETDSVVRQLQPADLNRTRHIVGWAPVVKKITGAIDAKYDIGWSALSKPSQGFALEEVQIIAGQYVTVGGTFTRGKREKAVHIKEPDDYIGRLKHMGEKFIVLYDVEVRKAWLVDGLSALLHLVRASLSRDRREDDYQAASPVDPAALVPKGGYSGRKAAFETLSNLQNLKIRVFRKDGPVQTDDEVREDDDSKFYLLKDLVKYIMSMLEQMTDYQADQRTERSAGYRIRTSPWAQLEGFDFMDVASRSDVAWPLATKLRGTGPGWVALARAIHAITLFGRGFGDLVEPVHEIRSGVPHADMSRCIRCLWNSSIPEQRDILGVCISDLERVVERRGAKLTHSWRLAEDIHLDIRAEVFSRCTPDRSCDHPSRIQLLQKRLIHSQQEDPGTKRERGKMSRLMSTISRRQSQPPCRVDVSPPLDSSNGAVLLGMKADTRGTKPSTAAQVKSLFATRSQRPKDIPLAPVLPTLASSNDTTTQDTALTPSASSHSTPITAPSSSAAVVTPTHVPRKAEKGKGVLRDDKG